MSQRQPSQSGRPLAALASLCESARRARRRSRSARCARRSLRSGHSHIVNIESRSLMCACRACYLLFTQQGAAQGKYKAVPDRYLMLQLVRTDAGALGGTPDSGGHGVLFLQFGAQARNRLLSQPRRRDGIAAAAGSMAEPGRGQSDSRNPRAGRGGVADQPPARRQLRMLPGADRRLLRTDRNRAPALEGFDGGEEARRDIDAFFDSLRAKCRSRSLAYRHERDRFPGAGRQAAALRRGSHACVPDADRGARRARRSIRFRCIARFVSSRSAAAIPGTKKNVCGSCSARRPQWGDSLKPFLWTHVDMMVRGFEGSTEVDLHVPCTYDFEVAAAKYLHSLGDGEIPAAVPVQRHRIRQRRKRD